MQREIDEKRKRRGYRKSLKKALKNYRDLGLPRPSTSRLVTSRHLNRPRPVYLSRPSPFISRKRPRDFSPMQSPSYKRPRLELRYPDIDAGFSTPPITPPYSIAKRFDAAFYEQIERMQNESPKNRRRWFFATSSDSDDD